MVGGCWKGKELFLVGDKEIIRFDGNRVMMSMKINAFQRKKGCSFLKERQQERILYSCDVFI